MIVEEPRRLRRIVRAAGDGGQRRAAVATADGLPFADGKIARHREAFRTVLNRDETGGEGRREHDAGNGRAVADEGDVDGESAAAGDEFLGAVERIDEEEQAAGNVWDIAGGDCLFPPRRGLRESGAPTRKESAVRPLRRPPSPANCPACSATHVRPGAVDRHDGAAGGKRGRSPSPVSVP